MEQEEVETMRGINKVNIYFSVLQTGYSVSQHNITYSVPLELTFYFHFFHLKILLENILPAHVAQHFLKKEQLQGINMAYFVFNSDEVLLNIFPSQDLYHESYSSVGVLFASIPNYKVSCVWILF